MTWEGLNPPYAMRDPAVEWCDPDDCPSSICAGPHVSHQCVDGYVATQHIDNPAPCPFCGRTVGQEAAQ